MIMAKFLKEGDEVIPVAAAYHIVLAVVRNSQGQFLLVDKKDGTGWWLPGGRPHFDETCEEAIQRYALSETGYRIKLQGVLRVEYTVADAIPSGWKTPGPYFRVFLSAFVDPTQTQPEEPHSLVDSTAKGAVWTTFPLLLSDVKKRKKVLKSGDALDWFAYVQNGGPIHPMNIIMPFGQPVPRDEEDHRMATAEHHHSMAQTPTAPMTSTSTQSRAAATENHSKKHKKGVRKPGNGKVGDRDKEKKEGAASGLIAKIFGGLKRDSVTDIDMGEDGPPGHTVPATPPHGVGAGTLNQRTPGGVQPSAQQTVGTNAVAAAMGAAVISTGAVNPHPGGNGGGVNPVIGAQANAVRDLLAADNAKRDKQKVGKKDGKVGQFVNGLVGAMIPGLAGAAAAGGGAPAAGVPVGIAHNPAVAAGAHGTLVLNSEAGEAPKAAPLLEIMEAKSKKDGIQWEEIQWGEKIGEGSFGEVYRGFLWGQEVALKTIKLDPNKTLQDQSGNIKDFLQEIDIMSQLRHPNIVEFLGASYKKGNLCIVTEFLPNGSLEAYVDKLKKKGKLCTYRRIVKIAKDIARGLNWLHHKGIIHRDLKSANILLDASNNAKIADFGLSHMKKQKMSSIGFYGVCGTSCYMAPEVLLDMSYNYKADIFSFGVILCELVLGEYPYEHANLPKTTKRFEDAIIQGARPVIPANCLPGVRDLIEACWQEDPKKRPDGDEIMNRISIIEAKIKNPDTDFLEELPEDVREQLEREKRKISELERAVEIERRRLDAEKSQFDSSKQTRRLDAEKSQLDSSGRRTSHPHWSQALPQQSLNSPTTPVSTNQQPGQPSPTADEERVIYSTTVRLRGMEHIFEMKYADTPFSAAQRFCKQHNITDNAHFERLIAHLKQFATSGTTP